MTSPNEPNVATGTIAESLLQVKEILDCGFAGMEQLIHRHVANDDVDATTKAMEIRRRWGSLRDQVDGLLQDFDLEIPDSIRSHLDGLGWVSAPDPGTQRILSNLKKSEWMFSSCTSKKRKRSRKSRVANYYFDIEKKRLLYHCKPKNGGEYTHHADSDGLDRVAIVVRKLWDDKQFDWLAISAELDDQVRGYQARLGIRFLQHLSVLEKVNASEAGGRGFYRVARDSGWSKENMQEKFLSALHKLSPPPAAAIGGDR